MDIHIHIDDRLIDGLKALHHRVSRRSLAVVTSLGIVGASLIADAAPVEDLVQFQDGAVIEADDFNENFEKLRRAIDDKFIRSASVIEVANCSALINELDKMEEVRILPGASVTIEIAAGTHACPNPIEVNHVDGQRLSIVGAGNDPDDVTLTFQGTGFVLQKSKVLGLLSNMTLEGNGVGTGLSSEWSGLINASNLEIRAFSDAARASLGGLLNLTDVHAVGGGTGRGYRVQSNSTLRLVDCSADSFEYGISVYQGGVANLDGAIRLSNNTGSGIWAGRLSVVNGAGAVTHENNAADEQPSEGSQIYD